MHVHNEQTDSSDSHWSLKPWQLSVSPLASLVMVVPLIADSTSGALAYVSYLMLLWYLHSLHWIVNDAQTLIQMKQY